MIRFGPKRVKTKTQKTTQRTKREREILFAYGKQKLSLEVLDAIIEYGRLLAVEEYRVVLEWGAILGHSRLTTLPQELARLQELKALVEILRLVIALLAPLAHPLLPILLDLLQALLALLLRGRGESQHIGQIRRGFGFGFLGAVGTLISIESDWDNYGMLFG